MVGKIVAALIALGSGGLLFMSLGKPAPALPEASAPRISWMPSRDDVKLTAPATPPPAPEKPPEPAPEPMKPPEPPPAPEPVAEKPAEPPAPAPEPVKPPEPPPVVAQPEPVKPEPVLAKAVVPAKAEPAVEKPAPKPEPVVAKAVEPVPEPKPAPVPEAKPEPKPEPKPAVVEAPAVEVEKGTLAVNSMPPGAHVVLDDRELGVTPFEGDVPVGVHRLKVLNGPNKKAQSVQVRSGMTATVQVDF